ncbi:lytic polysaccharide monooxygenase [Kitasatospora sp. NPDC051170]|uniref:lytic polysaccharide monooxygenase n=1 Tax=Kitasatospora sp. NPDC051170 TaxID=3364056 RepID=UPI0037B66556
MRKRYLIGAAAAAIILPIATALPAQSHGFINLPPSRSALCGANAVPWDCGDIQWEPQSVEGPKGFPTRGPADGTICAGADGRWAPLDDPHGGAWPTTKVTGGQQLTFTWEIEARHSTTNFKYYLTKPGYDAGQPITRASLDLNPFLTVPYNGRQPAATTTHTGTLPTGRTGHHVVVSVWTIADTSNAFYSCTDVLF